MPISPRWQQDERLGFAVANVVLWGSWGFLGFGVLDAPVVYFLTVVAPGTWLAAERFGTAAFGRDPLWWQLSGGAMLAAGLAVYRFVAALLVG